MTAEATENQAPRCTVSGAHVALIETEAGVTERVVTLPDGRKVRAGTAADAGRLCVTDRSPNGISGAQYRWYSSQSGDGRYRGTPAPGPIMVWDESLGKDVRVPDPETSGNLYDLDKVEEWNAARPGARRRTHIQLSTLRSTPVRRRLLDAAATGRLRTVGGRTLLDGEQVDDRTGQSIAELQKVGALEQWATISPRLREGTDDRIGLTPDGVALRTRWTQPRQSRPGVTRTPAPRKRRASPAAVPRKATA